MTPRYSTYGLCCPLNMRDIRSANVYMPAPAPACGCSHLLVIASALRPAAAGRHTVQRQRWASPSSRSA